MSYMENFNTFSDKDKVIALQCEISQEENWLEQTSNPMKTRRRVKYIKQLKKELQELQTV